MRALAPPGRSPPVRAVVAARKLPRAGKEFKRLVPAFCEVGEMLSDRLGLSAAVRALFAHFTERWDGKGPVSSAKGDEIPLPVRIAHVARDAAFQRMLGGDALAARVVRRASGRRLRSGDRQPARGRRRARSSRSSPAPRCGRTTLACEPSPQVTLEGEAIDRALAAMGELRRSRVSRTWSATRRESPRSPRRPGGAAVSTPPTS